MPPRRHLLRRARYPERHVCAFDFWARSLAAVLSSSAFRSLPTLRSALALLHAEHAGVACLVTSG